MLDIDLARALEVLSGAANRKGRGERTTRSSARNVLKALGEHPEGGEIKVLDGRYGPYVNYKKVNVTLPKEVKPEDVTLEQAVAWVANKSGQTPAAGKKKAPARKATAKAKTTKTAAARKKASAPSPTK